MNDIFQFNRLDARTRGLMLEEIDRAGDDGELIDSTRFNEVGRREWPGLIRRAAAEHDEHWLAYQLEAVAAMNELELRARPLGGYQNVHVPHTAAETLADGQFNRFYMAAICRRALADGRGEVRVYRAKYREEPRRDSLDLQDTTRDAGELLDELRNHDRALESDLLKPNSGLSVDY